VKHLRQERLRRACAALAALVWPALAGAPAQAQPVNRVLREVAFEQRVNARLPLESEFRDEAGGAVRLGDSFGRRPVVLALVYYDCPMLCTFILNGLVKGLKPVKFTPGREFDVVVISFDPRETPALAAEKKAAYLKEYGRAGTAAGWHFLTGEEKAIRSVTDAAGFRYFYDEQTQQFAHASGVIVATPEGKLYRYFYGIEYAPRDLRLALVEASANKLGTAVDQVLLYCFHYDPQTGKYGVLITRVIRLAGTASVLVLGAFLVVMFRRERRLSAAAPPAAPGAGRNDIPA
jgi:protein SCO1/2